MTKVSRISITRLFNTGDYEHTKYEITLDVGSDDDAQKAFEDLEQIISEINPNDPHAGWEQENAARIMCKKVEDLDQYERVQIEKCKQIKEEVDKHRQGRRDAIHRLNSIGGSLTETTSEPRLNES